MSARQRESGANAEFARPHSAAPRRAPVGATLYHLPAFRREPLRLLTRISRSAGDVCRLRFGPLELFLVTHPDAVQHVLQDNNKNYDKGSVGYSKLRLALGEGLLTSEGDFWLRQRRIMQPSFHRDRLQHFGQVMTDCTEAMLERWRAERPKGQALDIGAEMMGLTLEIIGKTMFSTDLSAEAGRLGEFMTIAMRYINERIMALTSLFDFPEKLPTAKNRRFRETLRQGDELVLALIRERRTTGKGPGDMLSMLMQIRDEETGEAMTDKQLRDEIITIFAAGHETTANALTWLWYLLSESPPAARKLREELRCVLGGRTPRVADLPRLEYTTMAVKEAMRLFPPAWVMSRRATGDDVLCGYHIPRHAVILLSPYLTHRHPRFWEDPKAFEPERFRPDRISSHHRYAYFPFGGGPRMCIGSGFAMTEAVLIVATIAQKYELCADAGHPVELDPLVTLRPKHGMWMVPSEIQS